MCSRFVLLAGRAGVGYGFRQQVLVAEGEEEDGRRQCVWVSRGREVALLADTISFLCTREGWAQV